ncbi:HK97 gp10 family phage protein [Paeniglutamicibacter sp. NPDC012692]|uniref:HK97 gp10 family phage protein n=1 Tax=Paeniglutamicibacter sp. NPDC012692 TaxID=3364388 RepID=UPI0036A342E6
MSKSDYRMDPQGLKALANTSGMSEAMVHAAQSGLNMARASAPRNTGKFADSFRVRAEKFKSGRRGEERSGAVIESTVDYGAYVGGKAPRNFMHSLVAHVEAGAK